LSCKSASSKWFACENEWPELAAVTKEGHS
jgi:hypothetical protein